MPALALDAPRRWSLSLPGGGRLPLVAGAPLVMGVVNVTPDSFSDGGRWLDPARAAERAFELGAQGADLIDLGAESTRPGGGVYGAGAQEVPAREELSRLLPVLRAIAGRLSVPISVDTRKAEVARVALAEGASLVNDTSALGDPAMAEVVAGAACPLVLMHSRGQLGTMQRDIAFGDVVREVRDELAAVADRAVSAGIAREQLIVDPGIGFGKTAEQNLRLIARLDALDELGLPVLLGASRKSFIGHVTGKPAGERLIGSLAAAAWGAARGAAIVRVHDVAATRELLDVLAAIAQAGAAP